MSECFHLFKLYEKYIMCLTLDLKSEHFLIQIFNPSYQCVESNSLL